MTWTAADGKLLKDLRTAAGLDRATLARRCTISAGQLAELEDGGTGRFYSEGIKAHTGRTVLARLGHVKAAEGAAGTLQAAGSQAPARNMGPGADPVDTTKVAASADTVDAAREPALLAGTHDDRDAAAPASRTWPWIAGLILVASAVGVALWLRGAGTPQAPVTALAPPTAPAAPQSAEATASEQPARAPEATPAPEPAPPQPAATVARAVASAAGAGACTLPAGTAAVAFTPERALKPSSYVYLEAIEAVAVCVVDARQRRNATTVTPGEGVTVSGTAPFTVHTPRWSALRVYFQGVRVPLDDPGLQGGSLLLQPTS